MQELLDALPHRFRVIEQILAFQNKDLFLGEKRFVAIQLLEIPTACHVTVLLNAVGISIR